MEEKLYKSPSGVDIYTYKNPSLHGFYISLFVKAGALYEEGELSGITHFLEHAVIRNVNSAEGGRLYSLLDEHGIEFNASTYSEMIQFYVSGASENFQIGADVLSKTLAPLLLNRRELDLERRRIKAEIRESDDKTSLISFTNKCVYEGTSLSKSILGCNKTIDKVTVAALETYRKKVFSGENIFFYVTGNFTEADIEYLGNKISAYSLSSTEGRDNTAPVPKKFGNRDATVAVKNADFTMIRFTFDLDMRGISSPAVDLLYDMLLTGYNSRLFIELSENRGLFYDLGGSVERYSNIGTFSFGYELKEKELEEAIALTFSILSELKNPEKASPDCMKAGYVDNALMLLDDARELNFTFAYDNHIMNMGFSSVEERREVYASVTNEDIAALAKKIFTPNNLTVTVKGNKKKINIERIREIALKELI